MKKLIGSILLGLLIFGGVKYNNYDNYKKDLINNYGEEIYLLMNEEIGVKNELESFGYYLINNK